MTDRVGMMSHGRLVAIHEAGEHDASDLVRASAVQATEAAA